MISAKHSNINDNALLLLVFSLFAGNMSGVLLLPRTMSFVVFPLLFRRQNDTTIPSSPKNLFFIWFIWGCFSLLFTPDFSEGVSQLLLLITNFLLSYEILVFAKNAHSPLYRIALGWLFALTINNIVGLWEITTDNHLSISKFGSEREIIIDGRAVLMHYANGFFSNYNSFVTFTCCALPFLFYLILYSNKTLIRGAVFANLFISVYTIFMDASRAGVLSLIVISAIFLIYLIKNRRAHFKNLIIFGVLICFVLLFWDSLTSLVIGRQLDIARFEDEARYVIWKNCIRVFLSTFGIGTGIGGLWTSMANYAGHNSVLAPHNAFLEILVQYGVLVFFTFIVFLKDIYSNGRRNEDALAKVVIFSSILSMPLTFIINSMYLTNPFFWAFLVSLYIFSDRKCFMCDSSRA